MSPPSRSRDPYPLSPPATSNITAHILAGGQASRMGGRDKGLVELAGKMMIRHVIARLSSQVNRFCISANRNPQHYAELGWPVLADTLADYPGPLAGFLTAMQHGETEWLLNVPCDCPLLPLDLVARLQQAVQQQQAQAAVVSTNGRLQPTFCLLHRSLQPALADYLQQGGRKTGEWLHQQRAALADFDDQAEAFFNINSPEELQHAETLLAQ